MHFLAVYTLFYFVFGFMVKMSFFIFTSMTIVDEYSPTQQRVCPS